MRALWFLPAAVLGGCSSQQGAPPPPAPQETVRISGGGGSETMAITIVPDRGGFRASVPFTVEKVWQVLPSVYDSVGIPRSRIDAAEHAIGNTGLKLRRRLRNTALSRFFECGQAQLSPNADSYEVYLSILTKVDPGADANTASIATTVDVRARPIEFSGDYVRCGSKGELERRIVNAVKWELLR